jgi:hypothetical protein
MFTRTTLLALAAVAAIGAALVTSTAPADAGGFSRGGGFASQGRGPAFNRGNFAKPIHVQHHRPHWQHHRHHHHHNHGYRPYSYGGGAAAVAAPAYAPAIAAPAAKPCTCLTKEYTADKMVVFKDRCTKEMAATPLGGMPQPAVQPPRPPQPPQPGEIEPQAPQPGEVEPQADGADAK